MPRTDPPSPPEAASPSAQDPFWERLVASHRALAAGDNAHPDLVAGDPALVARLLAPVEGEDSYQPPVVQTRDITLSDDTGCFQVRVYTPESPPRARRPLLVWVHGGAWAAGDLEGSEADATAREVCARADSIVVSVDYRLATGGVHYPVPLNDVVTAFTWAVTNAHDLGADPAAATLGGGSAGGNLAAGAALKLRDTGRLCPARLALIYPALHPVLPLTSGELQSKLVLLNPQMAADPHVYEVIVENYLGTTAEDADSYAMPGIADDLSGLPPTLIVNCEYDGLRASGEYFASQLQDGGVEVTMLMAPDVAHAHLARPGLPAATKTHEDLATWVTGRAPR